MPDRSTRAAQIQHSTLPRQAVVRVLHLVHSVTYSHADMPAEALVPASANSDCKSISELGRQLQSFGSRFHLIQHITLGSIAISFWIDVRYQGKFEFILDPAG